MSFIFHVLALHVALAGAPSALPQDDPAVIARRVASIASLAADEYAHGVADGRVTSDAEITEARLFLGEAREAAARLPEPVRGLALVRLDSLQTQVRDIVAPATLSAAVDRLRAALAEGLGIALDPLPEQPPSLALGRKLFAANCASCHGETGAGDGAAAAALDPPPANLTDRSALAAASPLTFFRKISVGVSGTAMEGYESRLSADERWALALYASGLRWALAGGSGGRDWVVDRCASCAEALSDFTALADANDDSLRAMLGAAAGLAPPDEAVAYARTAGAIEQLGGDRRLTVRRVTDKSSALIDEVVAQAAAGRREQARQRALEAYLVFEIIEREVGARSAAAVSEVERTFAELRASASEGGADVPARAEAARAALVRAAQAANSVGGPGVLFGQSLLIILREGLEAILILGAVTAFVIKAGARERLREIHWGAGLAVLASLLAAAAFATIIEVTAAQQEAIEGVTMLLASVVLFSVASWMVSKIEADKWRAFVRSKMQDALSSGGALALGGVAFLAVFREGVETVLFYAALYGTAKGTAGHAGVLGGLVVGAVVLVFVYLAIQRWGLRIPIRPFFAVTGILLTVMAVSFAGGGVAELQAAGWVPSTPVPVPAVPFLGLFPTVQTVLAQALLAAAFVLALAWIFWLGPRPATSRARGR